MEPEVSPVTRSIRRYTIRYPLTPSKCPVPPVIAFQLHDCVDSALAAEHSDVHQGRVEERRRIQEAFRRNFLTEQLR